MSKWEKKWDKHAFRFKNEIEKKCSDEDLAHFLSSSTLSVNLLLICIVDIIKNFKLKLYEFNIKNFEKNLNKLSEKQLHHLYKLCFMDYMILLSETQDFHTLIKRMNTSEDAFMNEIFKYLSFNDLEEKLYDELKTKKDSVYHSVLILEKLGLKEESKNEAIVDAAEIMKYEFYKQFDIRFSDMVVKK